MKMELAALGGTIASGSTLAHIDPAMGTDETHYFCEAPGLPRAMKCGLQNTAKRRLSYIVVAGYQGWHAVG